MTYPPPQSPYEAPPPPQQPPLGGPVAQKSKATPVIIVILSLVLLICLGCAGFGAYSFWWATDKAQEIVDSIPTDFPTDFPSIGSGAGAAHTVRYEVTGSGKATMVWAEVHVGQGGGEVTLPWTKEFTINEPNFGAQVIAVPKGADSKPDTCKIFIDGVEKRTAKFSSKTLTCSYVFVSK